MPVERTQDSYPRLLGLGFDDLGMRNDDERTDVNDMTKEEKAH